MLVHAEKPDLFVSYSRKDRNIVVPIVGILRISNIAVFRDEDSIAPGNRWHSKIEDSLKSCERLVLFWSKNARKSQHIEIEYRTAEALGKPIIPILMDSTPLPSPLSSYQWLDFRHFLSAAADRLTATKSKKKWGTSSIRRVPRSQEEIGETWQVGSDIPVLYILTESEAQEMKRQFQNRLAL